MIDGVKKAFEEIQKLPEKKQQELAQLIHDELSWENTFIQNQINSLKWLKKPWVNKTFR